MKSQERLIIRQQIFLLCTHDKVIFENVSRLSLSSRYCLGNGNRILDSSKYHSNSRRNFFSSISDNGGFIC